MHWAGLPIIDAGGGMHLCLGLPSGCDDRRLARGLNDQGVGVRALGDMGGTEPALILGFAAADQTAMREGVRRLEAALRPAIGQG